MPATQEPEVSPKSPLPVGYRFVPKGNVYITANCRKKTHAIGATVYLVVDPKVKGRASVKGIRVPHEVYQEVATAEQQTRAKRAAQVQAKDDAGSRVFEAEVRRLFPHAPPDSVAAIARHALVKRSRRVGRSTMMDMEHKVRLAVVAHIRHVETDYDALLKKGGTEREDARRQTWQRTNEVADQWAGRRNSLSARSATRRASKISRREKMTKGPQKISKQKTGDKGNKKSKNANGGDGKKNKTNEKPQKQTTNQAGKNDKGKRRTRQPGALGDVSASRRDDATRSKPVVATGDATQSQAPRHKLRGNLGGASNMRRTPYDKPDSFVVADDDGEPEPIDGAERSGESGDNDGESGLEDEEEEAEFSDDSEYQSSELDDGSEDEAQFTDYEGFESDGMDFRS
ncbi:hypothetical protein MAPG_08154 [Magnaporthiopsis poae ATCC 64411]|uniref:DUF2293 domain-containing protein n=1 Tax=Magnaporthiopsis poae (strain ATCC 64411 / 73-15) TaxID=644358 RepID=A0A0C4E6L1_MAGP6|nr:hypothetical protein MAPG_08154 [Magnaporthiopsis poae ATCC 64411]